MDLLMKPLYSTPRVDVDVDGDLDYLEDDENLAVDKQYQHENIYNKFLPYDVSAECREHLMRIKVSLAQCLELDQETVYEWFVELERFVDLYGLAFTKEEHIYLIKIQYELMVSKNSMDLYYIAYVASCFSRLMRKRYLISSDELQLDWRPLYETYERLFFSETESVGLRFIPENLESNLSQAIKLARLHFPVEATQEMLDEWRPKINRYGFRLQKAVIYMNLFLPTTLPPEHHDQGFKLWFDEVMQFWLSQKIYVSGNESKFTLLLSRLSSDCLGFIDWEPYIPKIFNHFKACLNLNGIYGKSKMRSKNDASDIGPMVQWMVYMISRTNSCLDHISKLFKGIESFYHPSNVDRRWHSKLQSFLHRLPACYVKRLYRERIKKNVWSKRIPESHRLTEEQTTRFVDSLMPVVLTSMFNQGAMSSAAATFRDLSALRPEKVIPPLLDRLYGSYDTLIEPYRLVSSINCMASVVPAMVRPSKYFPEGPSHVVPLLFNSLPGIDSNDMRKCITVFRFIATLASHVQIKDYSYLVNERQDLTLEQQQLCLSTGQFEDFVIQFLDRCFVLIENAATITTSNADQETHFKNGEEGIIESAISSVTLSILSQASPEIQEAALDKLYSHVTRNIFDTKTQGRAIATLCLACAKATPKNTLRKFLPYFGKLLITLTDNDEIFQDSTLDEELLFSLLLISEIVRCNSPHILDHKELIVKVLHRALNLNVKEAYMLGCSIIRHLLRALTNIACPDWRNIDDTDHEATEDGKFWPFSRWGHTTHVKDLKPQWQLPGPESRQFAQELLETFLKQAVKDLNDWSQGKKQLTRAQVQRALHTVLSCLVGASSVLPAIKSQIVNLCRYEVPVVQMCIRNTGTEPLDFVDGTSIRTWIVEQMKGILCFINKSHQDDINSLTLICEILSTCIVYFGYNKTELRLASQRIKSIKDGCQNKLLGPKRHLRYLLIERIVQQHRAMLFNKGDPNFTELHMDVFKSFFELSQSHYYEIRVLAQDTVYLMLSNFPFLETILVPMLVVELKKPELEHNKFKGLLHLVLGRRAYSSIAIDPNWSSLRHLWPALVESPHSEKHSIVKLLDRICNLVQKGFDTFELKYNFPDKIKQLATEVWSSSSIDLRNYQRPSEELKSRVKAAVEERNKQRIENYEQLVIKLVGHIDNHHLHWHRRIVAYNLFTHLIRDDHPLPLVALKLCVNSLISDRLSIRSKAVQLVSAQLKVLKRKYAKRTIPMRSMGKVETAVSRLEDTRSCLSMEGEKQDTDCEAKKNLESDGNMNPECCNTLSNSNKWLQYNLNEVNISKEEWGKLIFVDKPHIGFYDWPKELVVFEPHERQPKLDRQPEELSDYELIIYERFQDPSFVEKLVEYLCFEDSRSGNDPISRFIADMFKGLFRNYGLCMLEPFRKSIDENSASTCEHKHKFVLEFVGGLLKGSQHYSYEMMQQVRQFVLSTLERLPVTKENLEDWTCMIIYVFSNRDARRFLWLLDFIVRSAIMEANSSSPTITPFIQASRLTLAHQALIQCEWRAVDHIFPLVIDNLMPQCHLLSYANVRACLASIYSLVYTYDDPTPLTRIPGTLDHGPKRSRFIEFLLPRLAILGERRRASSSSNSNKTPPSGMDIDKPNDGDEKLMEVEAIATQSSVANMELTESGSNLSHDQIADMFAKYKTSPNSLSSSDLKALEEQLSAASGLPSDASSFVDSLRSALPQLADPALRSVQSSSNLINGDDPDETQERKEAIKLMKLTALWIVYIVCRMKCPVTADFFKLLPLICEMGRKNSDPELEADSLGAVAILGSSSLRPEAIVESLQCVRRIIVNNSWHARVAAAAFIEIMVSTNFFELLRNELWRSEIEDIVINYLVCDERIEVRTSSSLTLSGLIHCEFTKLTPELLTEFKRRASEPLVKRKQANGVTVIDSKSITVRHSGILCLCACVEAHPYTVPEYLPEILCLLSDHLTDPQPISTTIKKTMSNFRRTHHDNWQSDKTKFTDDQLCVLANLLVSPSYYA